MSDLKRNPAFSESKGSLKEEYERLNHDLFAIISEWHYMAILELMTVDGFEADVKWIARTLGLTLSEVKDAVARLENVGLLEIREDGCWRERSSGRTTNIAPNLTTAAMRNPQKQFLQKAIAALGDVPLSERDQSAMTMAIDIGKLPEARERIKEFRRDLAKYLCRSGGRNDVYNLSISLYPLTLLERNCT